MSIVLLVLMACAAGTVHWIAIERLKMEPSRADANRIFDKALAQYDEAYNAKTALERDEKYEKVVELMRACKPIYERIRVYRPGDVDIKNRLRDINTFIYCRCGEPSAIT